MVVLLFVMALAHFGSGSAEAAEVGAWPDVVEVNAGRGMAVELSQTAVQADGKVVAAGYSESRGWEGVTVARFTADGEPDPSFGIGGRTRITSDRFWFLEDMVVQPDGGILILGDGSTSISIARITPDGWLDTDFAHQGIASVYQYRDDGLPGSTITLDRSGAIVVAFTSHRRSEQGFTGVKETVIWKLDSGGARDESFGNSGVIRRAGRWSRIVVGSVAKSNGGVDVIAASRTRKHLWKGLAVLKPVLMSFDRQGRPDRSLGGNGMRALSGVYEAAESPGGRACQPRQARADMEGRILLLVNCFYGPLAKRTSGIVARYLSDGTIDRSFGTGGIQKVGPVRDGGWGRFVVASDASITLSATSFYPSRYLLGRLEADGAISADLGPKGFRVYMGSRSSAWGGISVNHERRVYSPIIRRGKRRETYGVVSFGRSGE